MLSQVFPTKTKLSALKKASITSNYYKFSVTSFYYKQKKFSITNTMQYNHSKNRIQAKLLLRFFFFTSSTSDSNKMKCRYMFFPVHFREVVVMQEIKKKN